ncbi:MAG: D-TA family PLP-dependent enzyme [Alphaproteobacteria bacterium]|jgi:D-serine deaminase-like pyridoxal phosphate-dependent protein|nr:D-TA family PLP-dependent enzyme [Alphaproteobacteria bacterium]
MELSQIQTPAVLIDIDVAERNIQDCQAYCDQHDITLRPHIKTHKLPRLAQAQIDAGAIGITCQKIGEAEVMAASGIKDILLTYNILGGAKLARLRTLHDEIKLSVTADNPVVLQGLSEAFADADWPLAVLIECDTGGNRCGVQSPQAAIELAEQIGQSMGLRFAGLMTYPAPGGTADVQAFMAEAKSMLGDNGYDCATVSSGGSPDLRQAHLAPIVDEYRVGTYIYNDRSLVTRGACALEDCALHVLATVISTPTPERAVIDAGSKVLTTDLFGLQGHGTVISHGEVAVAGLSEEHGHLDCSKTPGCFTVGDRVRVVPNHVCVVSNMVDQVYLMDGDDVFAVEEVAARGKVV